MIRREDERRIHGQGQGPRNFPHAPRVTMQGDPLIPSPRGGRQPPQSGWTWPLTGRHADAAAIVCAVIAVTIAANNDAAFETLGKLGVFVLLAPSVGGLLAYAIERLWPKERG